MSNPSKGHTTQTISIAPEGDRFLLGGTPGFLLADTLWAAFTRPTEDEWRLYLRRRRRQGFNAVNISILPIAHDRTLSDDTRAPFAVRPDGSWDLGALDDAYFTRARALLELAVAEGLIPVLAVLWVNYAPGTWGEQRTPGLVLDEAQTEAYVARVLDRFADLQPILAISGDDRFDSPAANARYRRILALIEERAPGCVTTFHSAPDAELPADLAALPRNAFYAYQSGHDLGWEERPATLAAQYRALPVRRPIVNLEPPYEGHGYGGGQGRHRAFAVRRASWSSVLAGAGAGLGYAAHGVWSWHRIGEPFLGEGFSGTPFPWEVALQLEGAWDVGLLRRLVERHGLYALTPRPDLVAGDRSGACAGSAADGTVAIYTPHPFALPLPARARRGARSSAGTSPPAARRPPRAWPRPATAACSSSRTSWATRSTSCRPAERPPGRRASARSARRAAGARRCPRAGRLPRASRTTAGSPPRRGSCSESRGRCGRPCCRTRC